MSSLLLDQLGKNPDRRWACSAGPLCTPGFIFSLLWLIKDITSAAKPALVSPPSQGAAQGLGAGGAQAAVSNSSQRNQGSLWEGQGEKNSFGNMSKNCVPSNI